MWAVQYTSIPKWAKFSTTYVERIYVRIPGFKPHCPQLSQIGKPRSVKRVQQKLSDTAFTEHGSKEKWRSVLLRAKFRMIYLEKWSLEVREVSENVSKTLPNIANAHIGIYREIGQQVLASIEETQTHRQKYFVCIDTFSNIEYQNMKVTGGRLLR